MTACIRSCRIVLQEHVSHCFNVWVLSCLVYLVGEGHEEPAKWAWIVKVVLLKGSSHATQKPRYFVDPINQLHQKVSASSSAKIIAPFSSRNGMTYVLRCAAEEQ